MDHYVTITTWVGEDGETKVERRRMPATTENTALAEEFLALSAGAEEPPDGVQVSWAKVSKWKWLATPA